jgi:general secretion pathway protein I
MKKCEHKKTNLRLPETEEAGFTLLEVMVAVAIIGMSFVSLLASQSQSVSIASISRFETVASMLAGQKLAEIQVEDFEQVSNGSGEFEDDFSNYRWQSEVNELTEDETGIVGSEGLLKRVELTVSRGDEDENFTITGIVMTKIEPAEDDKK